jgi:hypothetical protein
MLLSAKVGAMSAAGGRDDLPFAAIHITGDRLTQRFKAQPGPALFVCAAAVISDKPFPSHENTSSQIHRSAAATVAYGRCLRRRCSDWCNGRRVYGPHAPQLSSRASFAATLSASKVWCANICLISSFTRSSAASEWVVDELLAHPFLSFLRCPNPTLMIFRAKQYPAR